MKLPKVKICCISDIHEANLAIHYGASAIGLVSEMPSGPGVISEDEIRKIAEAVPNNIETFLLTSKQGSDQIIDQLKRCRTTAVQIVDELIDGNYEDIKDELPHIKIVKVLHIQDESNIKSAIKLSEKVDALLLDSGNKNLIIKQLGGTGRVHNWSISRRIVQNINIPVYLAGGLKSSNVKSAIELVRPYGIDICSGIRENGKLKEEMLTEFFNVVNSIGIN